ncbi:unnamed protein product [Caenorhabditis brenneri]
MADALYRYLGGKSFPPENTICHICHLGLRPILPQVTTLIFNIFVLRTITMTMRKWKFFPLLVKENIVKNMCIRDIVSFAKCSKKCQNLLSAVPIHRSSVLIDDNVHLQGFFAPGINLDMDLISLNHFSILATSRKFYVDQLKICVTTDECNHDLKNLIETLAKARKSLKVKELRMEIEVEHAELFTGILGVCDPSLIESIEIPELFSQEIYEEIVKTPHWKNCKQVKLNDMLSNRELNMPNVNIDDFLHFEKVELGVETLKTDDAVKFIQNFRHPSERTFFHIMIRKPIQQDLIPQEIEARWVGDWKRSERHATVFFIDPTKPDLVFYYKFDNWNYAVSGGWLTRDEFEIIQRLNGDPV